VLPERAMEVPCEPPDGRGEGTITRNRVQWAVRNRPRPWGPYSDKGLAARRW
jgi:hypothetical protein